ncbi:MAG: DUF2157 domain-containing protein [bacterium]|nr:DUF2157 domain-containing protein [bacterium]
MHKQDFLDLVKKAAHAEVASKAEILRAYESALSKNNKQIDISRAMYGIGGLIVVMGISFLVCQNWDLLNTFTKILSSLGAGIMAYIIGVILRDKKFEHLSNAFYFIALLVIPIGLYVTFDLAGYDVGTEGMQSVISALLLFMGLGSWFVFKRGIFAIASLIYFTWFYFAFTEFLPLGEFWKDDFEFFEYRALILGLSYILFGYYQSIKGNDSFVNTLYWFGLLGFLASALGLGGWEPDQNLFWELIYPGIVTGVIFLSVHLKNRVFLTMGSMFLIFYIFKITDEYFQEGLGWPLSLILFGLALIAIGYIAVRINQKYIKE